MTTRIFVGIRDSCAAFAAFEARLEASSDEPGELAGEGLDEGPVTLAVALGEPLGVDRAGLEPVPHAARVSTTRATAVHSAGRLTVITLGRLLAD
jgi:hypothetical protein